MKLWFSIYDFSFDYKGSEPSFISPGTLDWSSDFQNHFEEIKGELFNYLREHEPESYFNSSMVNEQNCWKTISLKWWGIEFKKRQHFFPVTNGILQKNPYLVSLSFNQLEPDGKILPHCGDTNAIYRCHFGIEIPEGLPNTGFRVRNEWKEWKENEWLFFMDAYNHEAINLSKKRRIIMVVDFLRPEFINKRNKIISTVLTSLFLQKKAEKLKFLYKSPNWFVRLIVFFLKPLAFISVKIVNLFKVY